MSTMFRFISPKKKMLFTNGRLLATRSRCTSTMVSPMSSDTTTKAMILSRRRRANSPGSKGGMSPEFFHRGSV